jgi:hypothetical protein
MSAKSLREVSEAMTAADKLRAMREADHGGTWARNILLNAEQAEALIAWVRSSESEDRCPRCGGRSDISPRHYPGCTFAFFERTLGEKP